MAKVIFGFAPVFTRYGKGSDPDQVDMADDILRQVTSRIRIASQKGVIETGSAVVKTTRELMYARYKEDTGKAGLAWRVIGGYGGVTRAGRHESMGWTLQVGSEAEVDKGGYNRFLNQGWTDRGGRPIRGRFMLQEALSIHMKERTLPSSIAKHYGSGTGGIR